MEYLNLIFDYSISILPAFLIAMIISAVLAETIPESFFVKVLGKKSFIAVVLSATVGALIPLCTCGMIPLASKLQKKGASWLVVISLLTSGNACSITALFMTLVLGLKLTFYRFLFSVIFGILVAYIFVLFYHPKNKLTTPQEEHGSHRHRSLLKKIIKEFIGLVYCFGPWIIVGIFVGGFIVLYTNPEDIATVAGTKNFLSPYLLAGAAFPFFFCAGTDIPITKSLLEKGAGLGSILTFMIASPGTNLTSFFIYQKWMGIKSSAIYLTISILVSGTLGFIANFVLSH